MDGREEDIISGSWHRPTLQIFDCQYTKYPAVESGNEAACSNVKLFPWMRHVVSACVSRSRCGSTTEAYLGAIGELSSSSSVVRHCLPQGFRAAGCGTWNLTLNFHVPALSSAATPPATSSLKLQTEILFQRHFLHMKEGRVALAATPSFVIIALAFQDKRTYLLIRWKSTHDGRRSTLSELRLSRRLVSDPYPQSGPAKKERMFLETVAQIDTFLTTEPQQQDKPLIPAELV